jgi:hypothetical protein
MTPPTKSIIHQLVRLERKVVKSVVSRTSSFTTKKDKKKPSKMNKTLYPLEDNSSAHTSTTVLVTAPSTQPLDKYDDDGEEDSLSSSDQSFFDVVSEIYNDELTEEKKLEESGVFASWQTQGEYRTVTQDDIIDKCLRSNVGKVVLYFYSNEDPEQREYLDKQLTQMANLFRGCKFLRVEGSLAPLMARKLKVKKFPTIVAMDNGNFVSCLSDTEGKKQGFVQEWFFKIDFVSFPPGLITMLAATR